MTDLKSAARFSLFGVLLACLAAAVAGLATALPASAQDRSSRVEGASEAVAPQAQGQCNPNRTKYRSETDSINTTSQTFVRALRIDIAPGRTNCVIVILTVDAWHPNPDEWLIVRARIPGISGKIAQPGELTLDARREDSSSVQFVFPTVPPGQHRVLIEYRSYNGEGVHLFTRMATVQYRK